MAFWGRPQPSSTHHGHGPSGPEAPWPAARSRGLAQGQGGGPAGGEAGDGPDGNWAIGRSWEKCVVDFVVFSLAFSEKNMVLMKFDGSGWSTSCHHGPLFCLLISAMWFCMSSLVITSLHPGLWLPWVLQDWISLDYVPEELLKDANFVLDFRMFLS